MPRIVWFTLGALAGAVYATRLLEENPEGAAEEIHHPPVQKPHVSTKEKVARMVEDRSDQLSDVIARQGDRLSAMVADRGQALANRLRQPKQAPQMGVRESGPVAATDNLVKPQTRLETPSARVSPYGTPTIRPGTMPTSDTFEESFENFRRP